MTRGTSTRRLVGPTLLALALLLPGGPAGAQTTTSTIVGVVSDNTGVLPGAQVVAVNADSGFRYEAVADGEGAFRLSGLAPGRWEIRVSSQAFKEQARTVELLVGQTVTVNFRLSLDQMYVEDVTVVGTAETQRLIDTRNPEVTTNITKEQIELLPQSSRNFLRFAGLAPGIRTADDENATQVFSSGGQNSRQANVYIDGVSQKNDVLVGGAFMQDASKGNPVPQNAVQEYKVITQNFKAEYEKASSAVVTAVTKSGANAFHGDALFLWQGDAMVSLDPITEERCEGVEGDYTCDPDYKRLQMGFSLGGPIVKDRLHFFGSYERNDQDRYADVYRGAQYASAPANVRTRLDAYETGLIKSPFTSNLYFGKVTWQPRVSDRLDVSYLGRDEDEERGFGGTRVFEGAEAFQVNSQSVTGKYTIAGSARWVNEAVLAYQMQQWHPTALSPDLVHENFFGLLDVGGKDSSQDFKQQRVTLGDDVTYLLGSHTLKGGVNYNYTTYDVKKRLWYNPTFNYRDTEQWQYPFEVIYGFGNPDLDINNNQFGLYAQDDWRLGPRVTLNVGLRWDYESNMNNNDWVSPPALVAALQSASRDYGGTVVRMSDVLDIPQFTTDGGDRSSYLGMFQPRVGLSWDVFGNAKSVMVASVGRYWDRVQLNDILDESFRLDWLRYRICFSADGGARGDCPFGTTRWDPKYFSTAELDALIQSGNVEGPEVFVLDNEVKPPMSDQWSIGWRQQLGGGWLGSVTYAGVRSENGLSWFFANQPPFATFNSRWGDRIPFSLQYPNGKTYEIYGLFKGMSYRESKHDAVFLTLDRPYTETSTWGLNVAYTYQRADQTGSSWAGDGGVAFELDYVFPEDLEWVPSNFDERHRFVASGTIGLPLGFRTSAILTIGSGYPYTIADASQGWDRFRYQWNAARPDAPAYQSLDLRGDWTVRLGSTTGVTLIAEAFNLFNWDNFTYDPWTSGFLPPAPEVNARFGEPTGAYNPRRFQIGARVAF
jgi:outer membrane receptor for ferrienterochelin and colicin